MKNILDKGKELVGDLTDTLGTQFTNGLSVMTEVVNGLPIFVSSEKMDAYGSDYDEKHYFVIPFAMSETGFSLHTMRCLPVGALEVNDLPKRRVFHFPSEYYEASLRTYLMASAKDVANANTRNQVSTLESFANDIDSLDTKLTYGMLLVGGIAAVFNPLLGVGIAAKAVTPGVASLLNKYGLRPAGEKMTRASIEKSAREAEQHVLSQFTEANVVKIVNPILQELELALRTSESEHDPLIDPNLADGSIPELDGSRWRELTEKAVWHLYKDVLSSPDQYQEAQLGPEDIRWLKVMFEQFSTRESESRHEF